MPSTRKILYTFLASPGDLQDEREAIRDVVDEFNESLADELGYHIELLGWENTVPGFGRPQELINQDVDRCDLFIGLIYKRWGTPPDKEGKFSSGFHEEFELSMARRKNSKSPEVALFFKDIPEEFMKDPGDDLKRILEFKESIITEKKMLFKEFSTTRDIEKLVRKRVTAHVLRVKAADADSEPKEVRAKPTDSKPEEETGEKKNLESSPFSAEGFSFLKSFVDRIGRQDAMADLRASEVARFRLLAHSISKPGNEAVAMGVHDINILFSARSEDMQLGESETRCLARLGIYHLSNENVPFWCWYSDLSRLDTGTDIDVALLEVFLASLFGANDETKVGAIKVLSTLERDIPTDRERRTLILDSWFSEKSSVRVRSAALEYLAKMGTMEEYAIAEREYRETSLLKALECMIGILLRTGQENLAQQLVLDSPFESLDADMLQAVLDGFENLETEKLLPGLEHRNIQVRLRALKILLERDSLDAEMAERLSRDKDASIRNEAIVALLKLGRSFTEEEIKTILITEGDSSKKGEEFFARYQIEQMKNISEGDLTRKIESSLELNDTAYFVRVERYFTQHVKKLRRDIDNTFEDYFKERIRRTRALYDPLLIDNKDYKDYIDRVDNIEDFYRKMITRQGLDVLCRAGKRGDLQRIRDNIQSGYAGVSKENVKYLEKHGEWTDIRLLLNVEIGAIALPSYYEDFQEDAAKTIIKISRGRSISELFALDMNPVILKKTIELCAKSRYSKISNDTLFELLYHESPDVRKAASIKVVQTFSVKRIKSILREYISSDKYRYYNVIHWLDLGASMSRNDAMKVARAATG